MVGPVLLIAVPLGLAFLIPLISLASRKAAMIVPVIACLFNLVVAITLIPAAMDAPIIQKLGGFPPPFCINLYAGPVGVMFAGLIALAGLGIAIYAMVYIKKGPVERYHLLYLLLLVGATGVVLTGDIFNLFVFFEILCISSYALVAYLGDRNGLEASVKYLIQGAVGSGLLLMGIGLVYGQFGTLNMADIASRMGSINQVSLFVPLALMVSGLGVEAAIFPLNAWLPDAHSSAPSSISAILSGIAIEVGLYAVVRIIFTVFGAGSILMFMVFLGALTLLVGEMCAFAQSNIKRMLAYSSIGQIGLIVFAVAMATSYSVAGGLFQLLTHTLSKALLFLSAGYMIYRSGSMEISSLHGMGKRMPLTSLGFTIGAFSLVGLPPFVGFPSKFLIVRAALARQQSLFTILLGFVLLGTLIEGAYFFRVVQALYFKRGNGDTSRSYAPAVALVSMLIFAAAIIVVGIYPQPVADAVGSAATELLDRAEYVRSVLQ
jgi:proton-translocating NADH-quinone oxidoreductase chain N